MQSAMEMGANERRQSRQKGGGVGGSLTVSVCICSTLLQHISLFVSSPAYPMISDDIDSPAMKR